MLIPFLFEMRKFSFNGMGDAGFLETKQLDHVSALRVPISQLSFYEV